MDPQKAVELAGGTRAKLIAVFASHGFDLSRQAISLWFRAGQIPKDRVAQLRLMRPRWFKNGTA